MDEIEQIVRPVAVEFRLFEQQFEQALITDNPLLKEVLGYATAHTGKRLRPLLILLSAQVCHGVSDKSIQAAVAIELLHTASLIHDDVVDNSPLRRGMDSVQAHWSNKLAVLTGDYMLSKSLDLMGSLRNSQMLSIVTELGQTLASGEILQLHRKANMWITESEYFRIIERKTAALFAACGSLGAVSSGATMKQLSALTAFGQNLGICFQLKDDALDYSDSEELGKPTMNDIRDGKATLPLLISLQRASRFEAQEMRELATSELDFEKENEIKSFVLRYDGIGYTYRQMDEHYQLALQALSAFHPSRARESLERLLAYAVQRQY